MIGKILADRYKILEEVGIGGMAIVYKAEDMLLRRPVAIKVLKDQYSEDSEFSDKFEVEAQSAASLSHPNIVSIYDVGSELIDGRNVQYIVMELIEGKTLKEMIVEEETISNEDTVYYAKQIAEALRAAHRNNIIHRDIKPQNIMITEDKRAKVTDFGIARISTAATITYTSSILGTVHYISPEQAKGKFIDYKSDIYSLGIVMYEMVTGKVPFDAENSVGIALKHIQDELVSPQKVNPKVSNKLNSIITKCLEKNPEDRYKDAQALIDDLDLDDSYFFSQEEKTIEEDEDSTEKISVYSTSRRKIKKTKKKSKAFRNVFIAIILALVTVTIGFFVFSAWKDRMYKDLVTAPNVVNMSEEEAISTLNNEGLSYNVIRRVNEDILDGFVFEQSPSPGVQLERGENVDIVISDSEDKLTMPNLVGMSYDEAKNILASQGLTISSEKYEESDQEQGTILSQIPEIDETISNQSQVSLVISHGQKNMVKMPKLLGASQTAAVTAIVDAGLVVGDVERRYSDEYPKGTVMWQIYDEGAEIIPGSSIDIIISKGEKNESQVPEGTIDLTDGSTESGQKIFTLAIVPPSEKDEFNLKIVRLRSGEETTVYNEDRSTGENIELNFKDFADSRLEVYYDDKLVQTTR